MRRTLLTIGSTLAVGALAGVAADDASARMSVIYEPVSAHREAVTSGRLGEPGLSQFDQVFQQQPTERLLPASQQAWKVSGNNGSRATPTILGRGPAGMAALLRDRVRRSGAHLVFVDELGSRFRGQQGSDFGVAMGQLTTEQSIIEGKTVAERVHIYVPNVSVLMAQPQAWSGSWDALIRAGGVWIEAYRQSAPWTAEQWLTWPGAFAREYVRRGGDPNRLHLLINGQDQAEQWSYARTGDACNILANGPGLYQTREAAPDWVTEFRRTFGEGDAPVDGPSPIRCTPSPQVPPETAAALANVFSGQDAGAELALGSLGSPQLFVGIENPLSVRLGPDPLGLAAALGVDPTEFWRSARAVVRADGDGWKATARLHNGVAKLKVLPTASGPVKLRLIVRGSSINKALGGPRDLVTSFEPFRETMPALYRRMMLSPRSWRFATTLSLNGRGVGTPAAFAYNAPPPESIRSFRMSLAGPARTRQLGPAAKNWRLVLAQAKDGNGVPVPAARIAVKRTDGTRKMVRTDIRGRARILTPRRQGVVSATVVGTETSAQLRVRAPGIL